MTLVRSAHASLGDQYCVHRGKRVVELAPAGRDKGLAIRAFMREAPFRGKPPVFIGDDVTDEHGFAMVNRLGGDSIKVGVGPTVAQWRFPSVRAVLAWLEHGTPGPTRSRSAQTDHLRRLRSSVTDLEKTYLAQVARARARKSSNSAIGSPV